MILRFLQQFEQGRDALTRNHRALEQRKRRISDAIDAAMFVVAIWIAQMMLHVADDRILPIGEVHRAVRADVDGDRPKVWVAGTDQWIDCFAFETGAIFADFDTVNALEADDIAIEEVTLELGWEMAARKQARSGARTGWPVPELLHVGVLGRVVNVTAESRSEVRVIAGSIGDEIVAPVIEHAAMRIGEMISNIGFEFASARFEAINGSVVVADGAGGGLDLCAVKDAIAEVNSAAWFEADRIRGVMRIG